jgi:hypothetical protein
MTPAEEGGYSVIGFCASRRRPMNDVARHTKGGFRPSSAINENGPSAKAVAALVREFIWKARRAD